MTQNVAYVVDTERELVAEPWESRAIIYSLTDVAFTVTDADYRTITLPCFPFMENSEKPS